MPIELFFGLAILLCSVVIHEVAHGYVAEWLGDPTARLAGRLTLNPLRHLDWFGSVLLPLMFLAFSPGFIFGWAKPVPYNPHNLRAGRAGPALVAVAGPAANLLLAIIFGLAFRFGIITTLGLDAATPLFAHIVLVNLMLAVFNLMPVPPLDGSRILVALLPYRYYWLERWLESYGLIFILVLLLVGSPLITQLVWFLSNLIVGPALLMLQM